MLFVIIAHDVANSLSKRQAARPAHLERLEVLQAEDRLVVAGPCPLAGDEENSQQERVQDHGQEHEQEQASGFSGSVIIADFADYATARAWADADPYVAAGVYNQVEIKPFKRVF